MQIVWIGVAGAFGAMARYGLTTLVHRACEGACIYGTMSANILGCFLFGLIFTLTERGVAISPETRVWILTGFMGAFTTFSTFIFESSRLMDERQWAMAILNIVVQIVIGLGFFVMGGAVARVV